MTRGFSNKERLFRAGKTIRTWKGLAQKERLFRGRKAFHTRKDCSEQEKLISGRNFQKEEAGYIKKLY